MFKIELKKIDELQLITHKLEILLYLQHLVITDASNGVSTSFNKNSIHSAGLYLTDCYEETVKNLCDLVYDKNFTSFVKVHSKKNLKINYRLPFIREARNYMISIKAISSFPRK